MSFINSQKIMMTEHEERKDAYKKLLSFGVDFLDDALLGITPNDLILVGAGSGLGKSQLCCNIALANVKKGKKVHYIALESEYGEIERRIKYQLFAKHFFNDSDRPRVSINYQEWRFGLFLESCEKYEGLAASEGIHLVDGLNTFYKQEKYGLNEFIENILYCANETDLVIVDHVHYFDFDDDNENRAIREIAKMARNLVQENNKPIILVSHLRKRDRNNQDLVPGMEEFHGSSDLFKIATKTITLAPGAFTNTGKFETIFRAAKNRYEGGVMRYIGSCNYLSSEGRYEEGYRIGDANQKREDGFAEMDVSLLPAWAKRARRGSVLPNIQGSVQKYRPWSKSTKNYVDVD